MMYAVIHAMSAVAAGGSIMEGRKQPFVVRPMQPADIDAVVEIERLANPSPWTAGQFRDELQNNCSTTDLLLVNDRIAAYICSWKIVDEMQIQNVATAPAFRRQGWAARLLSVVLDRAGANGVLKVFLEVRLGNHAARSLYAKFGFIERGIRPRYYSNNEDALIMELDLSS